MSRFIHTLDGKIVINDGSAESSYDAAWWVATQEPAYALPMDATDQYYVPTVERAWRLGTGPVLGAIPCS